MEKVSLPISPTDVAPSSNQPNSFDPDPPRPILIDPTPIIPSFDIFEKSTPKPPLNTWIAEITNYLDIIAAQRQTIKEQKTRIEELEQRLSKLEEEKYEKNDVYRLISVVEDLGLVIPASTLQQVLLIWAKTPAQLITVKNYWRKIRLVAKKNLAAHLQNQVESLQKDFRPNRHLYRDQEVIEDLKPSLLLINQRPMLKRFENENLVYVNDQLNFEGAKVLCAHADGKFSSCPTGFRQSFQLRLRLLRADREFTVLFAAGLLTGAKTEDYKEFFSTCKAFRCPSFPILIADFEIGISKAAQEVWRNVSIRGCNFHFMQNLLRMKRKLQRWLGQTPSDLLLNLLYVLPFLKRPHTYLRHFVEGLGLPGPEFFKNIDLKLLLYVFSTYCERLQGTFAQDLTTLATKTNNSCEGFNSGLERGFTKKPQVHEFVSFIGYAFKQDLMDLKSPKRTSEPLTPLLKSIQDRSIDHLLPIMTFLGTCGQIKVARACTLIRAFDQIELTGRAWISKAKDDEDRQFLRGVVVGYRAFSLEKRRRLEELQREKIRPLIEGLDFDNLLELTEVGSRLSFAEFESQKILPKEINQQEKTKIGAVQTEDSEVKKEQKIQTVQPPEHRQKKEKTKKKINKRTANRKQKDYRENKGLQEFKGGEESNPDTERDFEEESP